MLAVTVALRVMLSSTTQRTAMIRLTQAADVLYIVWPDGQVLRKFYSATDVEEYTKDEGRKAPHEEVVGRSPNKTSETIR